MHLTLGENLQFLILFWGVGGVIQEKFIAKHEKYFLNKEEIKNYIWKCTLICTSSEQYTSYLFTFRKEV